MSSSGVAKRYARAFIGAVSSGDLGAEVNGFFSFCDLVAGNGELHSLFANVTVSGENKLKVAVAVAEQLKLSTICTNFLKVLADSGRIDLLAEVRQAVAAAMDEKMGVVSVSLTTAHAPSSEELTRFEERMGAALDSKVRVSASQDASILGGAVARVGSTVFDGSVKGQLEKMRKEMTKEI